MSNMWSPEFAAGAVQLWLRNGMFVAIGACGRESSCRDVIARAAAPLGDFQRDTSERADTLLSRETVEAGFLFGKLRSYTEG